MADEQKPDVNQIASDILNDKSSIPSDTPMDSFTTEEVLSSSEADTMAKNALDEQNFGDKSLRTFVERAASSASFGLTDQALVKGAELIGGKKARLDMQKGLAERESRNKAAAIAGEITGVVAPALLSGGTSAVAKGAASGVKAAAKAGLAVEKVTAKQLAKILNRTGNKKLAKEVITKSMAKSAGSAVEGAFYGAGQLVKEDALGTAEFNAENLLSSIGTAAIIGGTAGGALGSASALVPVVKNNKVVDVVSKKVNNVVDKNRAAFNVMGKTPAYAEKFKAKSPWHAQVYDNTAKFFRERLKLQKFDSVEKLANGANQQVKTIANEIGDIVTKIDDSITTPGIRPTRAQVSNRITQNLNDLKSKIQESPGTEKVIKAYNKEIKKWTKWADDATEITAKDLKELKSNLQDIANYRRATDTLSDQEKIRRSVARAVRDEFVDLADRVSTTGNPLGSQLKKANLDYATALEVSKNLTEEVGKMNSASFLKFRDVLVADILVDVAGGGFGLATTALAGKKLLESKLAQKITILSNIEKANKRVSSKISKSVKNFFSGAKKAAVPTSTKVLLNTSFKLPDEQRSKPKNKQEAFSQISDDLSKLTQDPTLLIDHLSKNALLTTQAAPETSAAMMNATANAVQFLFEKMPKDASSSTALFNRKYEPSSIELAKFERYLATVENPMSALDDMESGTLTREAVEALQRVYPDIYARVQEEAIENIANNPDLSYDKRIQMGILLNIPADVSLQASNITALQQTFADEEQQQTAAIKEQGAVPTTQGGISKISFAEDAKSGTERIATRNQE